MLPMSQTSATATSALITPMTAAIGVMRSSLESVVKSLRWSSCRGVGNDLAVASAATSDVLEPMDSTSRGARRPDKSGRGDAKAITDSASP